MRAALLTIVLVAAAASVAQAATDVRRIEVDSTQALQEQLLAFAQERLHGTGLAVDSQQVWMSAAAPVTGATQFDVRPNWSAEAPVLPLTFELRPVAPADGSSVVSVTLGVALLREVWVTTRRLRKGSLVSCADLTLEQRPVQDLPKLALTGACDFASDAVSLRDIADGAVVRSSDVGKAPDVMAGMPVRVSVEAGAINVTTSAVALADASVGDQIDVRLQRPARTLRTRVAGPGLVQLVENHRE